MAPESLPDPIRAALDFTSVLERLGVRYVTAGSLASSLYGEPRSTDDIDIVADLRPTHMPDFLHLLGAGWYTNVETAYDAVTRGESFNVIQLDTAVKVDVFVVGRDAFDAHRVAHGRRIRVADDPAAELVMDTVEHTLLRKLEWFRRGGEASDRQWRDVIGVMKAQGTRLDHTVLAMWAERLGVTDLLARALNEAGI